MTETHQRQPDDWQERQKAIDISRSCIVQAPAGSGKTELLVQRILALLAVAEHPGEVLSITFTRKAAGEMSFRLLQALERACDDQPPSEPHAVETWSRARAVLEQDRNKKWNLLQNPAQLQLTTIDSLCAFLTRRMPWLSRFGDQPKVTDDPAQLYLLAAESLLSRLERGGQGQVAVERLLVHLDNRLVLLRELLVVMLGRRDQWLRHLMSHRNEDPRELLESSLDLYVSAFLNQLQVTLGVDTCSELMALLRFAASNLDNDHPFAIALQEDDKRVTLKQWQAISQLVLTSAGDVRKSVTKTIGFPADKTPLAQEMKSRALSQLEQLRGTPESTLLMALDKLPSTRYEAGQWQILESLIELLPLAVVELKNVFRSQGQVDFVEIAGSAHEALGSVTAPEELLLQLDSRLRHILVDEFQDTSYAQYELLTRLTAGWEPGDGRTLFVVGDPMQSIYRFREAEVGLYLRVCQKGLNDLPMEPVVLNTNFRSKANLVRWVNADFSSLFPEVEDEMRGAVRFSPAVAFDQSTAGTDVTAHGFIGRQDSAEAEQVVSLIKESQKGNPKGSVAVLVRSRSHLIEIVNALKTNGLRYQAQDIDPLVDRPAVQDILSLTRAIQHRADRVAWLSVLRAPWCGLSLEDLVKLCGQDARSTVWQLLTRPAKQSEMFDCLSEDGLRRIGRIIPVLERALKNRGRLSLRRLVESTWLGLSGPACVEESDLIDINQVFSLLEDFDVEGPLETLETQLAKLYAAPDPQAGPELQLMTIHKAKGLEFDTVILPGLGRGVRSRDRDLLRWLEHPDYGLLLAPLPPILSEQQEPTYKAIGHIHQEKDDYETLRLLYVAVTRAKSKLHLLGHVKINAKEELVPLKGSLLSVLWPSCEEAFSKDAALDDTSATKITPLLKMNRLPHSWLPHSLKKSLPITENVVQIASSGGHYVDESFQSRRVEEGRIVGVIVHGWLERFAVDGLKTWTVSSIREQSVSIKSQLNVQGIPQMRQEACLAAVLNCLENTLESKRGRWLLGAYPVSACELALNGVVEDQLVRASIDRTFVDDDGQRWVIDYKTSQPVKDIDPTLFMQNEAQRYHSQLLLYATLLKQLEPEQSPRAALYFPAFDGWIEACVEA